MTLVEDVTAWALGCGAEEAAAAQPGSGGGVPHTHGETELRFNGGEFFAYTDTTEHPGHRHHQSDSSLIRDAHASSWVSLKL